MPADRGIGGGRCIVMHQATGLCEDIGEAPQRRGPPHGERRLARIIWLEGNAAGISEPHIVEEEIRVGSERDVAERIDDLCLPSLSLIQRNVASSGEIHDMADTASNIVEYGEPSLGLRIGRLRRYRSQQFEKLSHLDHVGLADVLGSVGVRLAGARIRQALGQMFIGVELTGDSEWAGVSGDAQLVEFGVSVELEQSYLVQLLAEFSGTDDSVFVRHHVGDARDAVGLADADIGQDGGVRNVIDQP